MALYQRLGKLQDSTMENSCSITLINRRGELEEFDVLNFSKFVVGKFILSHAFLERERDDLIQDACLYILTHREEIEKRTANYVYVCVYNNVFDAIRNRLRFNRKTKVTVAPDDYGCFKKGYSFNVSKEEFETSDLLEGAMNRACVSADEKKLFRRYVKEPRGFFKRENIVFNTPEHYRFITYRRRISEVVAEEMGIPVPEKRGRV